MKKPIFMVVVLVLAAASGSAIASGKTIPISFFSGRGCPHCEEERRFFDELRKSEPALRVAEYEVWHDKRNAALLSSLLKARGMQPSGVPVTIIGNTVISGFSARKQALIKDAIESCRTVICEDPVVVLEKARNAQGHVQAPLSPPRTTGPAQAIESVDIPFLGATDSRTLSLPVLTLVIAGMDSFNPCAFFVLFTLLGLLVHAGSRKTMLLVGGVFVFFSGAIYFLFMAAWLNIFLIMGRVAVITTIAGCVSILIAGINIKDYFFFKKGVSLTIPDSAKPKLFDRMRRLLRSTSLLPLIAGTTVLAIAANSYELLCTAGFPMVFTRIMTLQELSVTSYYMYLALYNVVYVIPLFLIVLVFSLTLGSRKLTEQQGRLLKLMSGMMMLGLGAALVVNPALLNSVTISFLLLAGSLGISVLIAFAARRLGFD